MMRRGRKMLFLSHFFVFTTLQAIITTSIARCLFQTFYICIRNADHSLWPAPKHIILKDNLVVLVSNG